MAPFTVSAARFEPWLCLEAAAGGGFLVEIEGDGDDCEGGAPFVCTFGGGGRLILGGTAGSGTADTVPGAIAAALEKYQGKSLDTQVTTLAV